MTRVIFKWLLVIMSISALQQIYGEVSKEKLFANPSLISAKISPDGSTIAYVGADEKNISNVFILDGPAASRTQLTFFTTPEIIQFFWSSDSKRVLLLKDENGTGNLDLHGIHIHTKEHTVYTEKFVNVTAKVIHISPDHNSVVIGLNDRNPGFDDLYLLDLDSGRFDLLLKNDCYAKFLVSDHLDIILKIRINDEDGSWRVFTSNDDVFMKLTSSDAFQTEFLSYNEKSQSVYLLDNRFSDTTQLVVKSLTAKSDEKVLGTQSTSDVDDVLFIAVKPKAYASYDEQKKWHALDPSIQKDLTLLESQVGSNFEIINSNKNGTLWMVSISIPDKGVQFWIYDTKTQNLSPIHLPNPDHFSKMYSMVIPARDGKKLICYYTLPKAVDKGGYVDKPIPLVVVPHGGPFKGRDKFQFNPYHQWLASCGYAVLSVNFRLSSGFGKAFVTAGNGEWGGKAHLDVIDAIEACIAKGMTEKGKLAVFGSSYGGYESLACLTFSPDYFTCCVAICAPSNLKTVLDNVPNFWEFTSGPLSDKMLFFTKQAFITSMGGNPDDPKGSQYLQQCSPTNYLDAIKAPLLLVHGKNDHIVAEKESEQIYKSMKASNKKVSYILFPDEGHRFGKFANEMMYLDQAERFLSQHLGGSYRPVDSRILAASSAQVSN
ncbi:MAG TPA: prolyl oligopeptidase family serine peptidase [Rhabdochlamydiaceae bacterium]|jgi:dipeptidyl aminopeptidase/acylaminoacyl peptidase|nr:prolyl oligopeptidase family serine peptidase [Rhabdochlamydiaceae bacterium]